MEIGKYMIHKKNLSTFRGCSSAKHNLMFTKTGLIINYPKANKRGRKWNAALLSQRSSLPSLYATSNEFQAWRRKVMSRVQIIGQL